MFISRGPPLAAVDMTEREGPKREERGQSSNLFQWQFRRICDQRYPVKCLGLKWYLVVQSAHCLRGRKRILWQRQVRHDEQVEQVVAIHEHDL